MNRIFYTIPGKPKAQKTHRPRKLANKVLGLIAQAGKMGVRLVNALNYDPSAQDKRDINIQSRRYAPKSPITGPVLLYAAFYMPVPKGALKAVKDAAKHRDESPLTPREFAEISASVCVDTSEVEFSKSIHTKKPDTTNLTKLLEDALTGLMWVDDSQVQLGGCFKIYSHNPRAEIELFWT